MSNPVDDVLSPESVDPQTPSPEAVDEASPAEEAQATEAGAEGSEATAAGAEAGEEAAEEVAEEASTEASAEPEEARGEESATAEVEAAPARAAEEPASAEVEEPAPAEAAEESAPAEAAPAEAAAGEEGESSAADDESGGAEKAMDGKVVVASDDDDEQPGETMAQLEEALAKKQPVKGKVIGWNKGGYHVAIGKVAAFCPVSQIEIGNPRSPKRYLDKTFNFLVIEIQKGGRRVVLSRAEALKAEREARAALVRERLKAGEILEGRVSSLTNFGAFVDLGGGIEGLVHVSELSRRRVEHPKEMLSSGQSVKVQVLKIEKGGERISLSMKRLEADPWENLSERFPLGDEFTGKILRKTEFGLFVEVEPGLEGLVHLSRLPLGSSLESEEFEAGNEVQGWVHEIDSRRRRLSLSLRQVSSDNPWRGIGERFPVGDVVQGKVERLTNFGVFIELEPGLTGLLPFSALGGGGTANPRRQYHPGKEVSVRILGIDKDRKRISLGTESSKAEGNQQDYREYLKSQRKESGEGLSAMAAAFAKLQNQKKEGQQKES